eukprot:jgi/Hompol1/4952/HPOL_004078-RA
MSTAASASEFTIRKATVEDVPQILEFIRELADYEKLLHTVETTPELLARNLFGVGATENQVTPARAAQVAIAVETATSTPVGMALYFFNFSTFTGRPGLYLEDLFVREAYRGKGLGKMFFKWLAGIAYEGGCGRMEWAVLDWNEPARKFYAKIGAREMSDWVPCRLDAAALKRLAESE